MNIEMELQSLKQSVRRSKIAAGFAFALAAATIMVAATQPDDPFIELLKQNITFTTEDDGRTYMYLRQETVIEANLFVSGSLIVGQAGQSHDGVGWQWRLMTHPDLYPSLSLLYQEGEEEAKVYRAIIVKDDQVQDLTFDEQTAPEYSAFVERQSKDK